MSNGAGAILAAGLGVGVYWLYVETQKTQQPVYVPGNHPQTNSTGGKKGFDPAPLLSWGIDFLNGKFGTTTTTTGPVARRPDTLPGRNTPTAPVSRPPSTLPGGGTNTGLRLLSDLMRDFGLTRPQAAGVVGNLDHETGSFKFMQEINPVVPGSRGGYGFAQWTGPRRRDFEAWAAARGMNLASYNANYGFLKHELTNTSESRVIPRLRQTVTVEDAARVFSQVFLRPGIPHMSSRINRAKKYA